jgi:hypothetical protein
VLRSSKADDMLTGGSRTTKSQDQRRVAYSWEDVGQAMDIYTRGVIVFPS